MITALDTNIVVAFANQDHDDHDRVQKVFQTISRSRMVISPFVYSELHANPGFTPDTLDRELQSISIRIDKTVKDDVWTLAGKAFREYTQRRKKTIGDFPRRILPDFLIGAHALSSQAQFLTLDECTYRIAFPDLKLVSA
jgi:predicted nucleic acid-binding protein